MTSPVYLMHTLQNVLWSSLYLKILYAKSGAAQDLWIPLLNCKLLNKDFCAGTVWLRNRRSQWFGEHQIFYKNVRQKFSAIELPLLILCLNGKEVTWMYYDIDNGIFHMGHPTGYPVGYSVCYTEVVLQKVAS